MDAPLRVIQWATGSIGTHAIPAILEDPNLELVGVKVYSETKEGQDAGTLVGIDPIGVVATRDVDALLALEADCVLYAPLLADTGEICRLLEAGLNVITPAGWAYLKDGTEKQQIDQACAAGGVSFHGSGIHPGFSGDRLPVVLSGLSRRVDRVRVIEICNMSVMSESPEMVMDQLGFGLPADEARKNPPPLLDVMSTIFFQSMDMVAASLGFEIERYEKRFEFATCPHDVEISAGRIPAGHVAGQHYEYLGYVDDEAVIEFQTYWRMTPDLEPNWPYDAILEYRVEIDGDPPLQLSFGPVTDGSSTEFGLLATAMNCVNAIAPVCAAEPGMRTTLDLPPISAHGRFVRPNER